MATPRLITAAEAALDDLGDVKGPGPVTDGNIALFDGTTGTLLKAAGVVEGVATIDATTNVLVGDGAGNAIDSGSAIADLGSLLSLNTARVDASGSDETGSIGNLSKPFLTVQAAIDAFVSLSDSSTQFVIDFGNNQFYEDLTIGDQINLVFRGAVAGSSVNSYGPVPFSSLTLTAPAIITVKDCQLNGASINASDNLDFVLWNVDTGASAVTSTAASGKHLTVASPDNSGYNFQFIEADDIDTLTVIGVSCLPGNGGESIVVANSAATVEINNCRFSTFADGQAGLNEYVFTVNCPNSSVTIMDSVVQDITAHQVILRNSKALGTVSVSGEFSFFTDDQGPFSYDYDFARDGGASGTIALTASNGSKGTGLPTNFVVTGATLEVITPLDSALSLAHVAMTTGETAADLQAATLVSAPPWSSAALTALTILSKMTDLRSPAIVITTEDLTAGKFTLHIDGYQTA